MTVEHWLELARGPIFRFAFLFMILGMARHLILTGTGVFQAILRAGNRRLPHLQVLRSTLEWLFPFNKLESRIFYSVTSVLFHVGLILTPVFLTAHIVLWKRGIGLNWPGMSQQAADALTLLTIAAGIGLFLGRIANEHARSISRLQDFLLPPLLLVPFVSGFLASNPSLHPFPYEAVMLVHVMSANLIFFLMPTTKLAHAVLLPLAQTVSEVGWHFPANSGENTALALHKETEPV